MPAGQQLSHQAPSSANGASTAHELFALTDEQILEIEPEGEVSVAPGFSPASSPTRASGSSAPADVIPSEARDRGNTFESSESKSSRHDSSSPEAPRNDSQEQSTNGVQAAGEGPRTTSHQSAVTSHAPAEPPPWLAAQMKDPWGGGEARELWNGVLQARSEAAAYRAAFATPEDARALKELYPGGVDEARESATRARLLEDIDRAYFGVPGVSTEQTSAARADLAQRMLREDPAAFREMVFAGLRVLEQAEKGSGGEASASDLPRLAQVIARNRNDANVMAPFAAPSSTADGRPANNDAGLKPGATQNSHESPATSHESLVSSYSAFEKAANEDLERSVGTAIARTIDQALPNLKGSNRGEREGARQGMSLQDRLSAAVRHDVEAALKGDRQLGEQIAQILSERRFDNETRAQVVRLIDDRARQLVPRAARRVINDWTQTTLAAHRGNASRADVATARREVEPVAAQGLPTEQASVSAAASSRAAQTRPGSDPHRNASRSDARRVDYRKLSDEQILDL